MIASRNIVAICTHHIENPESESGRVPTTFPQKDGESVYCHPTALGNLIQYYLPHVKFRFVLVSGDSDVTVPTDVQAEADYILNHPLLLAWYSQNCTQPSGKLRQLPIGLDFHTMSQRNHEWGPKQAPVFQMGDLINIRNLNTPKRIACYSNFHFLVNTRYAQDRLDAIAKVPRELVFYEPHKIRRINSWQNMVTYKYILSPHGNGLDCHRTWEALALGCIPIVKTSPLDPLFAGLPVLIVRDWSDVTHELLNSFIPDTSCMEKLDLSYWNQLINKHVVPE
jgi:hypothetical protein